MTWDDDDRRKFENDLIHQRLTWLGVFEGLLFVAFKNGEHSSLFAILGLVVAFSIDEGIRSANREITKLGGQAHQGLRQVFMPGVAIPKIFICAWFIILIQSKWDSILSCLTSLVR